MCYNKLLIKNPNRAAAVHPTKVLMDKDHFGTISSNYIYVPCGKCKACVQRRANQWYVRLFYENKISMSSHFITLTYDQPPLSFNGLYTAQKSDLQKYFKRLRKHEKNNQTIKYYAVSEYGEKFERPHYHAIVFNVFDKRNFSKAWTVDKVPLGITHVGTVTPASINYVAGYIGKKTGIPTTDYDDRTPEFSLMSKNMGMYYVEQASQFHQQTQQGFTVINGIKYTLPRYYKHKLFRQVMLERELRIMHENSWITSEDYYSQMQWLDDHNLLTQKKISNDNYENFIQSQNRDVTNFNSFLAWEKNQLEVGKHSNSHVKTIINPKF